MREMTKEEFEKVLTGNRKPNPVSDRARNLLDQFLSSGADVMEVEESDFDNALSFSKKDDFRRAYENLRSLTFRVAYRNKDAAIKVRNGRLFIIKRSLTQKNKW